MKTVAIQKKSSIQNVRMLTMTAVLSAIAFVLAFFEFPVPLSPSFARMDLSDLPALIGAFAYGPTAGILIELVKNALQLLTSSTGGIGELILSWEAVLLRLPGLSINSIKQRKRRCLPVSSPAS